jgi:ADP-heptose:LPS heptosyltransferase
MTTPALRALKTTFLGAKLTLLTSAAGSAIAEYIPEVDNCLQFDAPWAKNDAAQGNGATAAMEDTLRRDSYDAAIIFTTFSQSALPAAMLCYLAGIPEVLGYCRENPYRLINQWVPDEEPFTLVRHEVERQLDLVAAVGAQRPDDAHLSLRVPDTSLQTVRHKLTQAGLNLTKPWLLLHAGASEQKRRYSLEDYVTAARQLHVEGWQIVLTGSEAEKPMLAPLARAPGVQALDLSGWLPIDELCAAISLSNMLISNNTGTVHIAAALGTPAVVLYAQTNPQHTPWQVPHCVLYFPVPEELRSSSPLLQGFRGPSEPQATPSAIVAAVHSLQNEKEKVWPS